MARYAHIVESWFDDLFTLGDLSAVDDLVAQDVTLHGQGDAGGFQSSEHFKDWLRWYSTSFTDREWTIHDTIEEGDKVVARYSGWVTYRGGLLDIPSNDQRILETGILIFRISEGMVQELWSEMSDLQVVMRLGAFPSPENTGG